MEPTLVAAVGAQRCRVGTDEVLDVLRHGVEDVAQRALGIELNWHTSALVTTDDLRPANARAGTANGVDWGFVSHRLAAGPPESAAVTAESAVLRATFETNPIPERIHPRMYVASR